MKQKEKQKTADALSERSHWMRIGWMWIKIKPLTLSQIYDMGASANDINSDDLSETEKVNTLAVLVKHSKDARAMQRVFLVCAFRSRWKRWLFGYYIRKRLTMIQMSGMLTYIASSFNANFFLTSIIFLSQTKVMTEPNQTTPRGQSSEE